MGKKVKGDHTPEQRAAIQPTLDDDIRWLPIEAAYERRLVERSGDIDLAIIDLMKVLAQGRLGLPSMVRSTATGEREFVAPAAWVDQIELLWSRTSGVRVVYRRRPGESNPNIVKPFRGGRFYVWLPDLDRIWPPPAGSAPVHRDDASDEPPRVKPGTKPTGNWPLLITQWLIEVAIEDPQRLQNVATLVVEAKIFLRNQIKWAPKDDKDLRAHIVAQLKRVRRSVVELPPNSP